MSAQKKLLEQIQAYAFAMTDLGLYLDTHPTDTNALTLYHEYKQKKAKATEEYEAKYQTIQQGADTPDKWGWVDDPWPWESTFGGVK